MERRRDYMDGRFEFAVYLNEFIIVKRRFDIEGFIEKSMNTIDFDHTLHAAYEMIHNDLKAKSMTYMWYNVWFGDFESLTEKELLSPTMEPWECQFKITVSDRGRVVAEKIWDGYCYPKAIKDKVDLTNKWVRLLGSDGQTEVFNKESFFNRDKVKQSPKLAMLYEMIFHKSDVLQDIIDRITEDCSSKKSDGTHARLSDYTRELQIGGMTYTTDIRAYNNTLARNWSATVKEKNQELKKK